jgi:hypothetical protein
LLIKFKKFAAPKIIYQLRNKNKEYRLKVLSALKKEEKEFIETFLKIIDERKNQDNCY